MRASEREGELKGGEEEQRAMSKGNDGRCATSNGKMRTKRKHLHLNVAC